MATTRKKILVQRYVEGMEKPELQEFELEATAEMTVLDALNAIKDTQDGSLTFRWSCRMALCGSCSAVVNGKPVLMCETSLKKLPDTVRVEPLRNFPIIKDLVVDIDDAFEKMRSVNPYLDRMEARVENKHLQSPAQRKRIAQSSQCIKCMICYSACPVYKVGENFMGPAAGALAYRYIAESRNKKKRRQLNAATGKKGVWGCSFVGECSTACPKRVDPAMALQRLKVMGALNLPKRLLDKE
ncbi:succinate dehydrogenase/fumarate reductase iron-sulfur subunit [Candidatus Peregrinibacteria bacterium CG11_big_fil_rev_8_21_14_0_20_46_8]|nr:MAG: succinate dehydrogenase/fumarate reductase iron-sulfur subunit [Candidatus Peregrinibacteria bacterium CG11_big_fil_rev_8_21_14_0_20_46_8]